MVNHPNFHRLIAESTTDMICVHDQQDFIIAVTPSVIEVFGLTQDDVIGRPISHFVAEEFTSEMDRNTFSRFFSSHNSKIRYQIKHGDGRLRWVETSFNRVEFEGELHLISNTRDITESAHLTDDLMQALNNEQEFSRFKSNLYSIASHEFKTPLAIIQANIEMLKVKRSEKLLDNALESMEEEIDHLVNMISDMLELKKLQGGRVNFKPSEFDVCEMILEIIKNDCGKAYPEINYNIDFESDSQLIYADYSLIRYSLNNVLMNAAKYSAGSTMIEVVVKHSADKVLIEVQDHGIGIPEEEKGNIFKSFYRAKNVGNISGTGIGLSIVKEFIDLHKGEIYFESRKEKGTRFFINIPKTTGS